MAILGLTFVMGVVALFRAPEPFPIALLVLVLACIAAFFRPTVGVYVLVFLTMVGDTVTMEWWPFTKNMSSQRVDLLRQRPAVPQPARAARRGHRWRRG